jgi:hypothetical protein
MGALGVINRLLEVDHDIDRKVCHDG